ncbi:MAG: hypothetical protein AMJ53_09975, partial [Gammaproteobacteria bacterium SG8_11]
MSCADQSKDQTMKKTNEQWKRELTPEQYRIARENGTEPPFSGEFYNHKDAGVYQCICCGSALFRSDDKFDSGSGWP